VNRIQKILLHLNSSDRILELGPLDKPLLQKSNSNVQYIDYATLSELRELYKNDPAVNCDLICEPDFIWGEKDLKEITSNSLFSGVLASHVIEHVPDIIGWLNEIESVLTDSGVLSLAIPDKRFTFDTHRRTSTISEMVEAYLLRSRRPNLRQIFDQVAFDLPVDTYTLWRNGIRPIDNVEETLEAAFSETIKVQNEQFYKNVHCWVFTPESFLQSMYFISSLGLSKFELTEFWPTELGAGEFITVMRKLPQDLSKVEVFRRQRLALEKFGLQKRWLDRPQSINQNYCKVDRLRFLFSRIFSQLNFTKKY
jgi:hypothetical protein